MSCKLVAVYGTLKRGEGNHGVMEADGGKFVGKAKTIHSYCMYGGWGFPRVTKDAEVSPIHVEVFEVDTTQHMDSLEGHPNFFRREQVQVALDMPNGEEVVNLAWMYFHPPVSGGGDIVEDGLWLRR